MLKTPIRKITRTVEEAPTRVRRVYHSPGSVRRVAVTGCAGKQSKGAYHKDKYIQQWVAEAMAANARIRGNFTSLKIVGDIIYPEGLKGNDPIEHMATIFKFLPNVYHGAGIVAPVNTIGGNHESNMRSVFGARTKKAAREKLDKFVHAIQTLQQQPFIQKLTRLCASFNENLDSQEATQNLDALKQLIHDANTHIKALLQGIKTADTESIKQKLDELLTRFPTQAGANQEAAAYAMYTMPADYYCEHCYDEDEKLLSIDFYLDSSHYPTDQAQRDWLKARLAGITDRNIPINIYTHHTAYFTTGRREFSAKEAGKNYLRQHKEGNQHKAFGSALLKDGLYNGGNPVCLYAAHEHTAHIQNIASICLSEKLKKRIPGVQVVAGTGGSNSNKTDFKSFVPGLGLLAGGYGYVVSEQHDDGSMVLHYYDTSRLDGEIGERVASFYYDKELKITRVDPANLDESLTTHIAPGLFKAHKTFFQKIQQAFVSGKLGILNLGIMLHSDAASDLEQGRKVLPRDAWEEFLCYSSEEKKYHTVKDLESYQIALENLLARYLPAHLTPFSSQLMALIGMIHDARKLMTTTQCTFKAAANEIASRIEKALEYKQKDIESVVNSKITESTPGGTQYDDESDDEFEDEEQEGTKIDVVSDEQQKRLPLGRKTLAHSTRVDISDFSVNHTGLSNCFRIASKVYLRTKLSNTTFSKDLQRLSQDMTVSPTYTALVISEYLLREGFDPISVAYYFSKLTLGKDLTFNRVFLAELYDRTNEWLPQGADAQKTELQAAFDEYDYEIRKQYKDTKPEAIARDKKASAVHAFLEKHAKERHSAFTEALLSANSVKKLAAVSSRALIQRYHGIKKIRHWAVLSVLNFKSAFRSGTSIANCVCSFKLFSGLGKRHFILRSRAKHLLQSLYDAIESAGADARYLPEKLDTFIQDHASQFFKKTERDSLNQTYHLKKRYRPNAFLMGLLRFIQEIQHCPNPQKPGYWTTWKTILLTQMQAQALIKPSKEKLKARQRGTGSYTLLS